MLERLEAARALRHDDAAGPLHPVLDRDLPGRGRVEPGDRLVGADEAGALAPQGLDLLLAELVAARAGCRDHGLAPRVVVLGDEAGVVEGHLGGGERHVSPAVGLHLEPLLDVVVGVEAVDLAGQLRVVAVGVEVGDAVDPALALLRGLPPRVGVLAVGGDHAHAGDHRAAGGVGQRDRGLRREDAGLGLGHQADTSLSSSGSERIMADWKPPKPLAVDIAVQIVLCLASFGV